jgi:Raf kinase inhibitor-like protein, YbhB/YbcL family
MEISSPAFRRGEAIPRKYTCDGDDASPPLAISGVPPEAKALALLMEDPDAPIGVFTHWILYDVQPSLKELPEAVPKRPEVAGLGLQGVNDFGRWGTAAPVRREATAPIATSSGCTRCRPPWGLGPRPRAATS